MPIVGKRYQRAHSMHEVEPAGPNDPPGCGAVAAVSRRSAFKRLAGVAVTASVGAASAAMADTRPDSAMQTVRVIEKDWRERLSDLFFRGELIADVLKDGTKAVLLGGALSLINLFLSEQREAQRTKRVSDYADLLRLRDLAKPTGSIGIVPADYIQERIDHLETILPVPHRRTSPVPQRPRPGRHSRWDTIFSIAPVVMFVLIVALMAIGKGQESRLNFLEVLGIIAVLLVVLYLVNRLGYWTSRVLDILIIRRISQVLISATICFLGIVACVAILLA
jgi:hypothetical protein